MNKYYRHSLIYLLILSPIILGLFLAPPGQPLARDGNLGLWLSQIIGAVVIAIVGLTGSFLMRKTKTADTISLISYAAAALLINGILALKTILD